ncbi:MAG: MAPEG family protein [Cyanobacterium sp. T60_A2020_053]|nr:MAPEG family protein [Cyanobacterium sp. T60_A2020_053]
MLLGASIVTLLALLVYFATIINVGRARMKYQVMPPAMTGNEDFERVVRVQQNTLEQLIFFLPLLWIFSAYVSELWGIILGGTWVVGRIIYAWGYSLEAKKRMPGFAISTLSALSLLSLCLVKLGLIVYQQLNF